MCLEVDSWSILSCWRAYRSMLVIRMFRVILAVDLTYLQLTFHREVWCHDSQFFIMENSIIDVLTHTHIHTRLMALCPGLPGWASTRKVKPIWILVKQETVSGSGISWTICKSALRSRQITTPTPHCSVFYRPDALPAAQPTASKHWRHKYKFTSTNVANVEITEITGCYTPTTMSGLSSKSHTHTSAHLMDLFLGLQGEPIPER